MRAWLTAAAALAALTLSACGSGSAAAPASAATRQVAHAYGSTPVPAAPQRIAVLGDETLDFALSAGIKPVGVTTTRGLNTPNPYVADKVAGIPVVGAIREIDYEALAKTAPDLIVGSAGGVDQAAYQELTRIAPTVVVGDPAAEFWAWREVIAKSGDAFGKPEVATRLIGEVEARLGAAKKAAGDVKGAKVVLVRWGADGPTPMYRGMQAGQLMKEMGYGFPQLVDVEKGGHGQTLSMERLDEIDVDHIFISSLNPEAETALEEAKASPTWRALKAVKEDRVRIVRNDLWNNGYGALSALEFLKDFSTAMKLPS
jgi:iron complex transport system substrate-binding protein